MNWRPPDWNELKPKAAGTIFGEENNSTFLPNVFNDGVEAGANAMLKAIEKELPDEIFMLTNPEDPEGES